MEITFPGQQADIADLSIDGRPVRYSLPPATGTHSECFADTNYQGNVRRATGKEIVAYAHGALVHGKNEWADQNRIIFPTLRYMRAPKVLTIVPLQRGKFGDLEGAMIVDEDLKGRGIAMETEVPADLTGWEVSEGGILRRDGRIVVPYDKWYKEQWGEDNGAVIAIFEGRDAAISLARTARNSGRSDKPLWKVDPAKISAPTRKVPVLGGLSDGLFLDCDSLGDGGRGCAPRVLN